MPTYTYATKELSISNAKAFAQAINGSGDGRSTKKSVILYVAIGRQLAWPNEPTPVEPTDTDDYLRHQVHREMIGAKKVNEGDYSHVTERYDWTSGTVYAMYRHTDKDFYERKGWVLTNQNNVYKCLYNNKGAASTVKPTGFSTLPFTTSDGYTWKYMYTVSLGDSNKFQTATHIPVKTLSASDGGIEGDRQWAVQQAAVNGSIEVAETVLTGSGYHYVANGAVEAGGVTTLRLSAAGDNPPSSIDKYYNGSSVYVISGTGAGQLRRIIKYSGTTKTLTVNTAFSTVCNTDTRVIISPTLTILGDGQGAKGYTEVDTSTGAISNVNIISVGSGYSRAYAEITSNTIHGSGATANVYISPAGGHGSDPIRELGADKLCLNVKLGVSDGVSANGNGFIPSNTTFRTISVLKDPVLKCDSNNNFVTTQKVANTSNSPDTLRLTTRMGISYNSMDGSNPVNALSAGDIITNERNRLKAELGTLEFVTDLGTTQRENNSLANAVKGANANIVYIRNDETIADDSFYTMYVNSKESYSDYPAFTKDDVILTNLSDTQVASVETIKGPEANTYSGEILFVENIQPVTRDPDQTEDIKIILDF